MKVSGGRLGGFCRRVQQRANRNHYDERFSIPSGPRKLASAIARNVFESWRVSCSMQPDFMIWVGVVLSFIASCVLTMVVRKYALAARLIDLPNSRSSHSVPTPRGGGLAVVITSAACIFIMTLLRIVDLSAGCALLGGGLLVAAVGFMDDRGSLPVSLRMAAHFVAAIWAMYFLGGLPEIRIGDTVLDAGMLGNVLGVLSIVWALNFFNFMDGIDGIAASEAVFVAGSGGLIGLFGATQTGIPLVAAVIAAASLGFLLWNWPPARIFMGDVGSGYLGYVIAVLAVASARDNPVAVFVWLILGAVFFVDATVTLLRRLARGARASEAHRTHVYQILARRFNSHRIVTLGVVFTDVALLLPLAWLAVRYPSQAWLIALLILSALSLVAAFVGAGKESTIANGTM